jgi:hypothetical protein
MSARTLLGEEILFAARSATRSSRVAAPLDLNAFGDHLDALD